ncbi:hypothetical protein Cantr_08837 [Candida viswanathii]|uniref:Uncharacterized protein n=1 Tax=Candida viswanathii TaxID=5486 RepID=A0A367YA08_9ASCO|nr:hypothetical protein Cantr_08837 [Candida viswanathii]
MLDQLSTTRFRRVLRPLLSKIHALNDLYSKNPLVFDFDISQVDINHRCNAQQQRQTRQPRPSKLRKLEEEPIPDFYDPKSADDRLRSLRLFISPELYKSYTELFHIVKSVLCLLKPKKQQHAWKLSCRCAFEIGKEMAESTRTTYYRLNNVSLFDPSLVSESIREINEELYEDLDDWMSEEMEPACVTDNYTREVFAGYIVRLIVIHSQTTLYMFVPVLVHWLRLQGAFLHQLGVFLSDEYFRFPHESTTNVEELNGLAFNDTLLVFWSLHAVNYWAPFMNARKLLEIVPHKISFDVFDELEVVLRLRGGYYREQVYCICQYDKNTNIIVMMMVNLLQHARKKLTSYEEAYGHFKEIYKLVLEVVRNWLPYYNRRFRDNRVMFESIAQLRGYMMPKLEVLSDQGYQYMKLYVNSKGLFRTVDVIGCYCTMPDNKPSTSSVDKVAKVAVKLEFDNTDFLYWLHEDT